MRILEIRVKNWAKHNPATRAKTHAWFKMSNDFFTDPDFYRASLESRMIWIFIMCAASKKTSDTIRLNTQMASDSLNVRIETVDYAIEELASIGCITLCESNDIHLRALQSKDGCTEKRREEKRREEKKREEKIVLVENEPEPKKNLSSVSPQENLKTDFCQTVITMLNSHCGAKYPTSDAYCSLIESRKTDGYSLEDFKKVITFRQDTWANDPKMRQWLRPETLFGPKFHSYLEESTRPKVKFKSKGHGVTPTPENPTGNPYTQEAIDKGLIA